jgi:hypothetical protein
VYVPLYSVWEGTEPELMVRMIDQYAPKPLKSILDATINRGRIWEGLDLPVQGVDNNPANVIGNKIPTTIADNTHLPMFRDCSFTVVVYDPPHVPEQGRDRTKDFNTRFGLDNAHAGENLAHTYPPFLREAGRLLIPDGILLVKLCDYTHRNKFQFATSDFTIAAEAHGFLHEGYHIKPRKKPIIDPRWKNARHPRQSHSMWLVFRKPVERGTNASHR